jgi:hypothetical protein
MPGPRRPTRAQGNMANATGNGLEQFVIDIVEKHGVKPVPYRQWFRSKDKFGQEILIRNYPYTSIYGSEGKTEFLLKSTRLTHDVRIECKWQQAAGSVDEKFPYLYLNCVERMPEQEVIILVDGGGYRKQALQWLKQAVRERKYQDIQQPKTIHVFQMGDFRRWANEVFLN